MKTSSTLRITLAVAVLAGAGLSGCASDYDNRGYNATYSHPNNTQGYYYGTGAQGNYYDPNNPNRTYYTDRPYYYQR